MPVELVSTSSRFWGRSRSKCDVDEKDVSDGQMPHQDAVESSNERYEDKALHVHTKAGELARGDVKFLLN